MEEYIDTNSFNTISELEAYRKKINEALNERASFISLCNRASELGEKSFLFIKESFESMSPELFKSNDGKKLINKYQAVIKSSNNLKSLHSLYENIRKADKSIDTDYFVNNIAGYDWNVNESTLAEDMKKLGRVLSEAYLFLGSDAEKFISKSNDTLSNAVEYIAENKKTSKNISEYSSAVKVIRENIEKSETESNIFESKDLENIAKTLVEEFNNKYAEGLSNDEIELIREISQNNDKAGIFESRKAICVEKIDAAISKSEDEDEKTRLKAIKEQVSAKVYDESKFTDDICNIVKMISVLG